MTILDSLPARPLRSSELEALREAESVVEAAPLGVHDAGSHPSAGDTAPPADADGVRAFALQAGETIHGLAFDPDSGWTVVARRPADDPEDLAAVRDALKNWEAKRAGRAAEEDEDAAVEPAGALAADAHETTESDR